MRNAIRTPICLVVLALMLVAAAVTSRARADERAFVYSYEATTMPKGGVEYEQWITWKTSKANDSDFDRLDIRHEIELGITDLFQLAFYFDWRYEDGESVEINRVSFHDVAVEGILNLTDPTTDPLGLALYGEIKGGEDLVELEGKIIVQKNIGQWILVWNGTIEAEWEEEDLHEDNGTFEQTIGASYQINPSIRVGAELVHEVGYEDWSEWGDHVVYLGPVVGYARKEWWVTVSPVFQITDVDDEPDFQTRLIFGINF